jgi:peptidase M23-like protein
VGLLGIAVLGAAFVGAVPSAAADTGWAWPLRGKVITPYRNGGDPYARGQHRGIDIAGPVGAAVRAATPGTVRFAGVAGSSGETVSIRTADGRFDTSYLHLSAIHVRKGERVQAGQRIGAVGTTGRRSAARPHLHFGVRAAGSRHAYRNPLDFLPPPAAPAPEPDRPRGAPAPVGAPGRPAPAPAPVRSPQGRRSPVPRRAPRPAPAPRVVPGLAPRAVPVPHGAPRMAPSPAGRREPLAEPGRGPAPRGAPELGPRATPTADAHAKPAPAPNGHPAPAPHGHPAPNGQAAPARGPDLGLVLACLGLLCAAALVGGTDEGRRTASRGRERIASLLRPLAGRS